MRKLAFLVMVFAAIFIVGCNEGVAPDNSANAPKQGGKTPDGQESEGATSEVPDK